MSLWKKNLYIMWVCQFLAMMGMSAIVPFLPLFIRELGVTELKETARWSGLVFAGPFFLSFFLAPLWGSLGDKYGRKIMTLRAVFGLAIAQIIVGFSQDPIQLFTGRLLQGALSGFLPAAMALIASNTPEEKTGYALGLLQSSSAAGNIMGPLFGGVLSDLIGFRNVFFAVAILLTVSGLLVMIFVVEEKKVSKEKRPGFLENWRYLLKNKNLLYPAVMIMLTALGLAFVRPIFVLYVETLDVNKNILPTVTGILFSIMGIFATISSAWWGRRIEGKGNIRNNLIIAAVLSALMYSVHAVIYDPYKLIPVEIILGFAYGALLPLMFTTVSLNINVERRGGILGIATSFQILGNMIGPILGGAAAAAFGLRINFLLTGVIFLLIAAVSFFKINR
jgi:MFS transporter, DHA1 family, multidrug resistance protein